MSGDSPASLLTGAPAGGPQRVVSCRLGRVSYEAAWSLQREIQEKLIAAKRSEPAVPLPHLLLLVEHEPVFTLGKSGDEHNLVWDADRRQREGVAFHRIDRGGDITFHGPGQMVGYPILDLDRFFTDIHRYLRELEEAVMQTLASWGLPSGRVPGRTGVWIGPDSKGSERKICAMGVRCSRWVTMHGLALNVHTDLHYYQGIIPCGIDDRGVTSLQAEVGVKTPLSMDAVMDTFERSFADQFACDVLRPKDEDVWSFLSSFLGRSVRSEDLRTLFDR